MKFGKLLFLILTGYFFFPQPAQAQPIGLAASIRWLTVLPATCRPTVKTQTFVYLRGTGLFQCSTSNIWTNVGGTSGELPSRIMVANDQPGANLGAKINAADTACGATVGCEIWVFDGGSAAANTISTQVVVGSYHSLRFFSGIFYCNFFTQSGVILLKDNAQLVGSGWNTIIVENDDPNVQTYNPAIGLTTGTRTANYRIVAPFNTQFICTKESLANTCRSSNLHVRDIQFKGVRSNQHDGGVAGAVGMGNCYGCSIRHCWFNEVSGYAAVFGATPAGAEAENGTTYTYGGVVYYPANYAKDGFFTDNLITNNQSQNFALITVENMRVERNIFREPGKRPYTITSVTNPAGAPIVVTLNEAHHIPGGNRVRLLEVTATGGAPPISPTTEYLAKPIAGQSTKFSLVSLVNTGTESNPIYITPVNGTGSGSYKVTAASKTDYRGIFVVGLDVEPNGSFYERVNNVTISDNLFDFRVCNGIATGAIAYQITAAGIANGGANISNNTIWGNETGTGTMSIGITISNPYTTGATISNNYIKGGGGNNIGIFLSGDRLTAGDNTLVDAGGGGSGSVQTSFLTNSSVVNTNIRNPTFGMSSIRERGVSTNNYWANNFVNFQYHDAGSTITNSIYKDNFWASGIPSQTGFYETTGSNNNIFDGNITRPKLISNDAFGLTIVGATSKVISHKFTDGRTFIPNLNGVKMPFTNPN